VTRDGNFTPLLLDPIDFGTLYQQQLEAQEQQAEGVIGNA
jgi:preprotein translocase subunit SecB